MLFKLFKQIATWELLGEHLGTPSHAGYDLERYATILEQAMVRGEPIYSAAYIMPSGSGSSRTAASTGAICASSRR